MSAKPDCFGEYTPGQPHAERCCGDCSAYSSCSLETVARLAHLKPGPLTVERDPAGLPPHAPGAKLDGEKVMAELTLDGFSRALLAVAEVSTYGARKYSPGGWQHVEDGQTRYRRAGDRHRLARGHEPYDLESGLLHLAHEAWNRLAELELMLRADAVDRAIPDLDPGSATSPAGRHTGAPDAAPEQAATEEHRAAGKPAGDTSDQRWRVDFRRRSDCVPSSMHVLAGSAREAALRFNEMQGVLEEVRRAE